MLASKQNEYLRPNREPFLTSFCGKNLFSPTNKQNNPKLNYMFSINSKQEVLPETCGQAIDVPDLVATALSYE